jgi:hypothetical protein
MSATADELANELGRIDAKARELRSRLARTLLTNPPANGRAAAHEHWTSAWRSWHGELLRNPNEAAPTEPVPTEDHPDGAFGGVPWPQQQEMLFDARREHIRRMNADEAA